jgi:hypothetical protein
MPFLNVHVCKSDTGLWTCVTITQDTKNTICTTFFNDGRSPLVTSSTYADGHNYEHSLSDKEKEYWITTSKQYL